MEIAYQRCEIHFNAFISSKIRNEKKNVATWIIDKNLKTLEKI